MSERYQLPPSIGEFLSRYPKRQQSEAMEMSHGGKKSIAQRIWEYPLYDFDGETSEPKPKRERDPEPESKREPESPAPVASGNAPKSGDTPSGAPSSGGPQAGSAPGEQNATPPGSGVGSNNGGAAA